LIDYVGGHNGGADHAARAARRDDIRHQGGRRKFAVACRRRNPEKKAKIGFSPEGADGLSFEGMRITKLVHPQPRGTGALSVMAIVNTLDAVLSRKSSVSVQHMGGPR